MEPHLIMKLWSLSCMLALLLAAPLAAAPPAAAPTLVLQVGHSGGVYALAYSPDGKSLVTCDGAARLWDVATGQLKATLQGDNRIETLAYSPDGKTLATGYWDSTALWDVGSWQRKAVLNCDGGHVIGLAFSRDGQMLATSTNSLHQDFYYPGTAQLWDAGSGRLKMTQDGATGPLAFSPDGKTLAIVIAIVIHDDPVYTVQLWDVTGGQLKTTLPTGPSIRGGFSSFIRGTLAFSPDGSTLAVGSGSEVRLWDVASRNSRRSSGSTMRVR